MKEALSFLSNCHVSSLLSPVIKPASNKPRCRFKAEMEIRVCVNRTCRRQGSMQTLEILSGIAPPDILVKSCGCIGRCGAGPNLVVQPDAVFVSHCGTAARAAQFMTALCGGEDSDASKALDAYAWRKRAEDEFRKGYFAEADVLLSQAYICQGDAFLGMDQFVEAEKSYLTCLEIDPSIRRSKSFKARIAKLEEKLSAANICQSN